jgi:uncharacterized protein (DUF58 family)
MLSPELAHQVRRIEITTNRIVNELLGGQYESAFKGRGMEFDAVREYEPGDEIRSIDWNVTARTGRPYVKRFVEERELTVMLVVDASASMAFGSVRELKDRMAAELCAVLAFSAIKNHDKVGLLLCSNRVEKFIPPKRGSKHVLRVISELLTFRATQPGTDLRAGLEYLTSVLHRRAVVFLVSDFFSGDFRSSLAAANRRHDVIAVHLVDPRQASLPPIGWIRLRDPETGEEMELNSSLPSVRAGYAEWHARHQRRLAQIAQSAGVDVVEVKTDQPLIDPLVQFFRMRLMKR